MRKPQISVSLFGQDCTPLTSDKQITAQDLRSAAITLLAGVAAIEQGMHGAVEHASGAAHVGVDFGGRFSDKHGLPRLEFSVQLAEEPIIAIWRPKIKKGKKRK